MYHPDEKKTVGAGGASNANANGRGLGGVGVGVEGDMGNKQQQFLSYVSSVNLSTGLAAAAGAAAAAAAATVTADGSTGSSDDMNANNKCPPPFGSDTFSSGGGERSCVGLPGDTLQSSSLLLPTTRSIANSYQRTDERLMVLSAPVAPSSQSSTLGPDKQVVEQSAPVPARVPSKQLQQEQQQEQKRTQSKEQKQLQQIPGEDGTIRVPSGSGYRIMKPFPWRLQ